MRGDSCSCRRASLAPLAVCSPWCTRLLPLSNPPAAFVDIIPILINSSSSSSSCPLRRLLQLQGRATSVPLQQRRQIYLPCVCVGLAASSTRLKEGPAAKRQLLLQKGDTRGLRDVPLGQDFTLFCVAAFYILTHISNRFSVSLSVPRISLLSVRTARCSSGA